MKRVAILGAGGMGTALALLFSKSVRSVQLWARDTTHAAELAGTRTNVPHLPGIRLPDTVEVPPNACAAAGGAGLIVAASPSAFLGASLDGLVEGIPPRTPMLSVVKAIENATFARP